MIRLNPPIRTLLILTLFLLTGFYASAHVVVQDLDQMGKRDAAVLYTVLGFQHILPLGLDHICFVLSLFLLSPKLKPIVLQSSAFTLAHS
ncbi:MAG TPA: HupE/UreJ family protein, partial [Sediminibacterium sp.]|nr:HupE/UreJ family protein [Sediminibacterium sp.]